MAIYSVGKCCVWLEYAYLSLGAILARQVSWRTHLVTSRTHVEGTLGRYHNDAPTPRAQWRWEQQCSCTRITYIWLVGYLVLRRTCVPGFAGRCTSDTHLAGSRTHAEVGTRLLAQRLRTEVAPDQHRRSCVG